MRPTPGQPARDAQQPEPNGSVISPIADLTYRHYDGPLKTRAIRWWIVALAGIRHAIRKWWFWLIVLFSVWPYAYYALMLYLETRLGPEFATAMFGASQGKRYAGIFFRAYDFHLFWLMVIGLVVGAGSIAADNRSSALQVYLAKPITKNDYLLGKWMSVFSVVLTAALIPSLLLYAFCLLSFWSDGFPRQEPWLIVQIVGVGAVTAAGFASVFVGISAWCKSPMVSGAIGAGAYFASGIIAGILWLAIYHRDIRAGDVGVGSLLQNSSIGGVLKSVAWNIYDVSLRSPRGHGRMLEPVEMGPPTLWVMLTAYAVMVVAGIVAARIKVRAVEVISG